MGRISCAGGVLVAVAGTGEVGVVVVDVLVSFEAASFCPRAEARCVLGKTLGRLRGREGEPSIRGVPNFPGCDTGLLANAERSSAVYWVPQSWSSSWCETSLGGAFSFGVADKESWELSSETSFCRALTRALTWSTTERLRFPFEEGRG